MKTEAEIRASVKYNRKQDNIMIRPDKATGAKIRQAAESSGQPLQRWIIETCLDRIDRESKIE